MPEYEIVWEMNEENSISLVLFNLRNRIHFFHRAFPEEVLDFSSGSDHRQNVLRQIRLMEEAVEKIYNWYHDPERVYN